jgi:hypothetical protein
VNVTALALTVSAVVEVTVTIRALVVVDPAAALKANGPGSIASIPPPLPGPTVNVTPSACTPPPLIVNTTCPAYVAAGSPAGLAYTTYPKEVAGPNEPVGLTESQLPPKFVFTVALSVTAFSEVTLIDCEMSVVDPNAALNDTPPGLIVSVPSLLVPTVNVTPSVCVAPPLIENATCPVYVPFAIPLGFANTV